MKKKILTMILAMSVSVVALTNTCYAISVSGGGRFYGNESISEGEKRYSAGMYKVGVDIPAGEYVLFASSGSGYFCVSSDSNADDIIFNDNFDYNSIITIRDGEYLDLSRCYAVSFNDAEEIATDVTGSMYKVGVHIPSGEYRLDSGNDMGYYCIYSDSRHDNIVSNDNFEGQNYVTVSDGQYLLLSRCEFVNPPAPMDKIYTDAETIKLVQEALNNAGYECGTADGIAGAKTKSAITQYQTDKGLGVNGSITDELLEAIESSKTETSSKDITSSIGVPIDVFVARYNEGVDYYNIGIADEYGYNHISHITKELATGTESFSPDGELKLSLNPNTTHKDVVGIINAFAENMDNLDSNMALGEITALFYAFDENLSPADALTLFTDLAQTATIEKNGITYDNYSFGGLMVLKGQYDGFEIIED